MVRRILLAIAFVAVLTVIPFGSAYAQCAGTGGPPGLNKGLCVYSVKFVCGLQLPIPGQVPPFEPPVKPGNYATAVNIHNFHNGQSATIAKKAVIANPENQPPGQISKFTTLTLQPDQALEIDCPDIASLLANPTTVLPPFIKGFVEVVSRVPLSVTGVYTAQACDMSTAGQVCAQNTPVSIDVVPEQAFTGP
jgi:hypothetical protein